MGNILAIVGRPNVGKSTLYNRLVGEREAIIDDISGVTRDRIYGSCTWNGKTFTVIDTGGFVKDSDDVFDKAIRSQVHIALDEADVIIFMTDVTTGITDLDEDLAGILRRSEKPIILAVNKVDNNNRMLEANEFWSLGFENTLFLSSITGSGSGEILDLVTESISDEAPEELDLPRIAILGQPNVGKSSLVNSLLGEERNIVTDIAGTTRDAINTRFNKFDKDFILVDTAGIRKKSRVHEDLEFYSVMRAIRALEDCDVCLLMIDATLGMEAQDMSIFRLAQKRHKGIVILVNKWDLKDKETNTARDYEAEIRERISPFSDVPIVFISATEKQRIMKAIEISLEVYANKTRRIKTSEINEFLEEITDKNPPPYHRGRSIKIKYATQLPSKNPSFAFFTNYPKHIKENYRNYIENQLRSRYNFSGIPINIFFRKK
jgi:GTP-binding protein